MQEFRNRAELLMMSALYILGHGASFCSLWPLCHMSKSDCTNFFHVFLDEMNNMHNEFIRMPKMRLSWSQLRKVTKKPAYQDVVGQWMLFTCGGCIVPLVT